MNDAFVNGLFIEKETKRLKYKFNLYLSFFFFYMAMISQPLKPE